MFGSSAKPDAAGGSSSDESDSGVTDLTVTPDSKCMDEHEKTPNHSSDELVRPKTPHQPYFFKFSLEWMDRPNWPTKNKRLFTPCLPVASQLHVQHCRSLSDSKSTDLDTASENLSTSENTADETPTEEHETIPAPSSQLAADSQPRTPTMKNSPLPRLPARPTHEYLVASKYAGRALAEWAHIVSECDSFFARRRDEGVPSDRRVETPSLGVESFRK
jgi:hypothetical protein